MSNGENVENKNPDWGKCRKQKSRITKNLELKNVENKNLELQKCRIEKIPKTKMSN